jgi:taurine dehydrogenase small subunit
MSRNDKITIELLDAIQDGFNRQDVDAILSFFADDCEWLMARGPTAPEGRRCRGKAEIGDVLRSRYEVITDMRWDDMRHWIVDDSKAISEWVVRGTLPDGSKLDLLGCDLWEFRDGLVTKKDTYWKTIDPA